MMMMRGSWNDNSVVDAFTLSETGTDIHSHEALGHKGSFSSMATGVLAVTDPQSGPVGSLSFIFLNLNLLSVRTSFIDPFKPVGDTPLDFPFFSRGSNTVERRLCGS